MMQQAPVSLTELISCLMLEYDLEKVELVGKHYAEKEQETYALSNRNFLVDLTNRNGESVKLHPDHLSLVSAVCSFIWGTCGDENGNLVKVIWHLDTKTIELWTELAHYYRRLKVVRLSQYPNLRGMVESFTEHYCWGEPLTEVKIVGSYNVSFEDSLSAAVNCLRDGEFVARMCYNGTVLSSVDAPDRMLRDLISKNFRESLLVVRLLSNLGLHREETSPLITSGFFIRILPGLSLIELRHDWIGDGVQLVGFYDDEEILGEKR